VAIPDSAKNIQVVLDSVGIVLILPCAMTIPQANNVITTVLIAVARFESTPVIPILARIEVAAAKIADSSANNSHASIATVYPEPSFQYN